MAPLYSGRFGMIMAHIWVCAIGTMSGGTFFGKHRAYDIGELFRCREFSLATPAPAILNLVDKRSIFGKYGFYEIHSKKPGSADQDYT
jgi:hypothetical protein